MRKRKLNRRLGYDYSMPGAYFITINVKYQDRIFGKIDNGQMILSEYGKIADKCWKEIPDHIENTEIDEYIIMPDHVHGIIFISYGTGMPVPYSDRIIRDNDELERIREYIRQNSIFIYE